MAKVSKRILDIVKPTYDDAKNYSWSPDDEFVLNGTGFSITYNTLRKIALGGITAISPMEIIRCYEALHELLVKGIEDGIIKELNEKAPE